MNTTNSTEKQPELIHQVSAWMHYIGGHYRSPEHFIREAQRQGITRRIPAQVARGMQYGDRVILLRYGGPGKVLAFAEMVIRSLVLDSRIAQQVGAQLQAQGRANYSAGGGLVERECGCYAVEGTWSVTADLAEIVEMAIQAGEKVGGDVFVMIGGALTEVYAAPVLLQPAPKFTRGFIRADQAATFEFYDRPEPEAEARAIVSIQDYHQRERRRTPRLAAGLAAG